jgi:hypothetical protein
MRLFPSKKQEKSQSPNVNRGDTTRDTIFALLRRIEARVSELETNVSTLRRDLNRIDRKVYRESEGVSPIKEDNLPEIWRSL